VHESLAKRAQGSFTALLRLSESFSSGLFYEKSFSKKSPEPSLHEKLSESSSEVARGSFAESLFIQEP